MLIHILKLFQKNHRGELLWYIRLRAFIGLCCLVGVLVYFVILLIELSKYEKYIIVGELSIGDKDYNGSIPFPDSIAVSTAYFSSQKANITCYTSTQAEIKREYPGCVGLLTIGSVDEDNIIYKPAMESLMWFSDLEQCTLDQICPSLIYFEIVFSFPPVDLMNASFASPDIQVMISNTFIWPASFKLTDPVMATTYNLEYGDIYSVDFKWTKYFSISRNPYYINTQQSSKKSVGSNYTSASMSFVYTTETITTNTERYVTSIGNVLSLIGGLYSGIATIFSFLFGMGILFPWGVLPKYFFRPYIVGPLREEYSIVNSANERSCPLGDPLPMSSSKDDLSPENFAYLQARVAKLESLLARFYLDADLLRTTPAEISTEKSSYDRTK